MKTVVGIFGLSAGEWRCGLCEGRSKPRFSSVEEKRQHLERAHQAIIRDFGDGYQYEAPVPDGHELLRAPFSVLAPR